MAPTEQVRRGGSRRRGSMFVETAVGVAVAAIAMIAIAQLVAVLARQRTEVAQQRLATQAAANVMERVMSLGWDELTAENLDGLELPPAVQRGLLDPELQIAVASADGALLQKQVEVRLDWRDQSGRRVAPIQLLACKHQAPPAE